MAIQIGKIALSSQVIVMKVVELSVLYNSHYMMINSIGLFKYYIFNIQKYILKSNSNWEDCIIRPSHCNESCRTQSK